MPGHAFVPFTESHLHGADVRRFLDISLSHALELDDTVTRPGGGQGIDPSREGSPRQDLLAALVLLDAVDTKVPADGRDHTFARTRRAGA